MGVLDIRYFNYLKYLIYAFLINILFKYYQLNSVLKINFSRVTSYPGIMNDMKIVLEFLEKFDGSISFEIWQKKFEMVMKIQKITDPAPYLPFLLSGVALNIYMESDEKTQSSCDRFFKILNNSFGLTRRSAYSQLINLQYHEGETIDEYASQVKMLATKVDDLTKAAFMAGLPFELQVDLERAGDQPLTEMIEYSRRYLGIKKGLLQGSMAAIQHGNNNKETGSSGGQGELDKPRANLQKGPYVYRERDTKSKESNHHKGSQWQSNRQTICYKCQKPGHIAKYCRSGNEQGSL